MIDLELLTDRLELADRVARILIAGHKGSTPRETGTSMLVDSLGQTGTIGGGRLEFDAVNRALEMLEKGPAIEVRRHALGPAMGQCCGGAVTLITEVWDSERYRSQVRERKFTYFGIHSRQIEGTAPMPPALRRRVRKLEQDELSFPTIFEKGWLIEPVWHEKRWVYIYGAGHVGKALARSLSIFPEFRAVLVDVRPDQVGDLPDNVGISIDTHPGEVMKSAEADAAHFIMTPEHSFDLELCDTLLRQPFAYGGLIGSQTKWARFQKRLLALGHEKSSINRIECPIGDPALGKRPEAIALGITNALILWEKSRKAGAMP